MSNILNEIGQAIPNEFATLSNWTQYIPYIGWLTKALGGIDTAATTYADLHDKEDVGEGEAIMTAIQRAIGNYMGTSMEPGPRQSLTG